MYRTLIFVALFALLPRPASAELLDRGLAVTDPGTLRILDAKFAAPPLAPFIAEIDGAIDRYVAAQRNADPNARIGVGENFDIRIFDRTAFTSSQTRFALSGIINRMDRAYLAPEQCGEIRLIYRLTRAGEAGTSRLPMTMSAVLRARSGDTAPPCSELARRWLALPGKGDAAPVLALVDPENLDRIEFNLQIAVVPRSSTRAFRTDYLMMVFRRNATGVFRPSPMENQIDLARLAADPALDAEFKAWLYDNLADFDRGTLLVPDRFLATEAIASTPSQAIAPIIGGAAAVVALAQASRNGVTLQNTRSPAGFARRLNDITCTGCHETRSIGGFHFPGVDTAAGVYGSPFFFGDQPRRRDIVSAIAAGQTPDFSRGFSDRPQRRGDTLRGTSYDDGWGATCYRPHADPAQDDPSFHDWTCTAGLSCQPAPNADASSRIGMCFIAVK